jgi:hypothetical protein
MKRKKNKLLEDELIKKKNESKEIKELKCMNK